MDDWPTQGGTFRAWKPQRLHAGEWQDLPIIDLPGDGGVPYPMMCSGIVKTLALCGYAQAMALAWFYAAMQDAAGKAYQVRVQEYAVEYDIKARKIDPTPTTR
jgi:hypothetical protein